MDIDGKVAIITGGLRGIGYATVQQLLKNNAKHVAIFDLPKSSDEKVIANLNMLRLQHGKDKVEYYSCDVTKKEQFLECFGIVSKHQDYVDILVNNAGVGRDNQADLMIDVNYKALVNCTLIAINHMGKHKGGKGGAIVNIGSYLGLIHEPLVPIYSGTKHAVVAFTRSFKDHTEYLGVRVLCICPGLTRTEMIDVEDLRKGLLDFIPDKVFEDVKTAKTQKPDNVASAVVQIIENGEGGNVWLAQNDEPPAEIPEPHYLEKIAKPVKSQ